VHAIRASTGIGKTQGFAARLAQHLQTTNDKRPLLYLVPTHRLGDDTAKHFEKQHLTARVYRGRDAPDPKLLKEGLPKHEQVKMCLNLEQVKLATACGQDVNSACCKNKEQQCQFYGECGFQRQFEGERPNVWLAAHTMLYRPQKLFNDVAGIVLDETYYRGGVRGLDASKEEDKGFTVDDMYMKPGADIMAPENREYHIGRGEVVDILREQPLGGLQRDLLVGEITPEECTKYNGLEWQTVNSVQLSPQMTDVELSEIREMVPMIRRAKFMAGVWHALRELLQMPEGTVSGRLVLEKNKKGKRVLRHRGVREIVKARKVPTLILDATLPDVSILRMWHPQVEVVADIEVEMPPHVHIRQVIGAPVSQRKLWGTKKKPAKEHNLKSIRRYILQRWLETDRQPMLVICQMDVEHWLKEAGLPDGIAVEHFNAISGLDQYKHVRSLILIGRTIPSPSVVEAFAGALTAVQPTKVATTGNWYDRVTRGIRLADGNGIAVECDEHPDPMAEAIRYQICEAELLQALGRARGVNREPNEPLTVDIVSDVVLPATVNEAIPWTEPSPLVEMQVEGIVLTAPGDMAKAWPAVWATVDAAKWMLEGLRALWRCGRGNQGVFSIEYYTIGKTPSLGLLYRTAFNKTRPVAAFFDPRMLPNPRLWLETRLGALASLFHLVRRGEVAPISPQAGVTVNDALVTVVKPKPRDILDQSYLNPRAKRPWRAPLWTESDRQAFIAKTRNGPDVWQISRKPAGERRLGS
jgi:DEAD/DEAH box helicase